ncbi:MAG TPA: SDR family oxidoreductase [Pyrinomonadaceae bacterium]|nr:SDR family oxidoreductase [Pyrinomonadaceae bacterium]
MDLGIKGKVALVAAASQGLGRAVADELATEGASLVICARGKERLDEACDSIRERTGVDVLGIAGDLSNASDLERIVNEGIARFGQVDILVTNTGGPPAGPFESLSRESWDQAVNGLLFSVVELTRLLLPGMKERRWGRILNVTSIAAKQPVDNLILSNSVRAGVTGFAKTLANEVAEYGVTVNNILPGYTATERVEELAQTIAAREGVDASAIRARWEAEIPMKRLGSPHEFGALAAFLVSERASYITGSSIAVDGGWIRSLF